MSVWLKYIVFVCLLTGNLLAKSQQDIPERDIRFIETLQSELQLTEGQRLTVDSIYVCNQKELSILQHEIDSLERSEITEKELNLKIAVLNQKKKDVREFREMELLDVFTVEQQTVYREKIKPAKPQVLHFGIHNRADCNVCTK
ncbi:MAG: hypothetical protein HKN32_02160 [Flavobacteriales bacterium]|nr:hypothetical protein [Flavobacteriales bacterium]